MRCVILEDEIPAQNILKNYIDKIHYLELVGVFKACEEVHTFFKNRQADIIFLDINLPDISGIDFIKTIKNPPKVVMTTAYPDYALDSFELDTIIDYLVKPFSFDRFLKAIRKVENLNNNFTTETKSVFINVDKTLHKLTINDILYIESDRNYITIVTANKKSVLIDSLKKWNDKLPDSFLQIHKSFIVNVSKIDKVSGNEVYIDDRRIPIGRTFKPELLKKIEVN